MVFRLVVIGAIIVLVAGVCTSMSEQVDATKEKAEIKQVIDNSIGWAANKDIEVLYNAVAQDSAFFIYHPTSTSTIVGFDAFKSMAEKVFLNPAFKATGYEIKDLRINLSKGGDVAWYSAMLDDRGEWNGQPTDWINARWTGVLEKREGRWVITQMHFSFASDT